MDSTIVNEKNLRGWEGVCPEYVQGFVLVPNNAM